MPKPTITDEKEGRAALKSFLETMPILGKVSTRRRRIDSRSDFVTKFGVDPPANSGVNQKIVRFAEIEFLQYVDSPTEGFDDCPVLQITYGIHIFQEFFDGTDDVNSNDDFISSILQMRNKFLDVRERDLTSWELVTDPLTMPGFAQFGSDTFTDCVGHIADLNVIGSFYDPENP